MDAVRKTHLFAGLFRIPSRWKNVLYLHIPFCVQRCDFCIYFSKVPSSRAEIDDFVSGELLPRLDEYVSPLELAPFDEVYFGGGTPTTLSPAQIELICGRIPRFGEIPFRALEASPKTIRKEHVEVLAQLGFGYISLGVQTRDTETLAAHNREIVPERRLAEIVDWIEGAGMIANLDLICFLKSGSIDDAAQIDADLAWVMEDLRPTSITVHSEYRARKSIAKQIAMVRSIRHACTRSGLYSCTNSLLEPADFESDMRRGAEYRLMRRDKDFSFHLLGKLPAALRFGHNVLAVGEYDRFPLRTNYLHVSNRLAEGNVIELVREARANEAELTRVRLRLGLTARDWSRDDAYFDRAEDEHRFYEVLRAAKLPDLALPLAALTGALGAHS